MILNASRGENRHIATTQVVTQEGQVTGNLDYWGSMGGGERGVREQRLLNSEGKWFLTWKCAPNPSISGCHSKDIFRDKTSQKVYSRVPFLRKLLENVLPLNGGLTQKERGKESGKQR